MKICPECKAKYSDTQIICSEDGTGLVSAEAIDPRKLVLGIGFVVGGFFVAGPLLAVPIAIGVGIWAFFAYKRPPK